MAQKKKGAKNSTSANADSLPQNWVKIVTDNYPEYNHRDGIEHLKAVKAGKISDHAVHTILEAVKSGALSEK